MTQKEKHLLLADLCGRLPYGVICKSKLYRNILFNSSHIPLIESEEIKPYLRPMWSMTEDEINEYENFITNEKDDQLKFCNELVFYNRHHLDYRGLIPMGLAFEAPEGMYDIK